MHNTLEGIVPVELSLCLKDLISKRHLTIEMLNQTIRYFNYTKHHYMEHYPQLIRKLGPLSMVTTMHASFPLNVQRVIRISS